MTDWKTLSGDCRIQLVWRGPGCHTDALLHTPAGTHKLMEFRGRDDGLWAARDWLAGVC